MYTNIEQDSINRSKAPHALSENMGRSMKRKNGNDDRKAPPLTKSVIRSSSNNKRAVGAGPSNHPPPAFPAHLPRPTQGFLRNECPLKNSFAAALETSYEGFAVDKNLIAADNERDQLLYTLQNEIGSAFRKDVTQPFGLGTKCAKTYVTRCLVGEPGTTYKYLGLRMFSHPWPESVRRLKDLLSDRTTHHLSELDAKRRKREVRTTQGRNAFDICLINCMNPSSELKEEPISQLQTTVSWHADSSLEHFSTIAVYQLILSKTNKENTKRCNERRDCASDWSIALRVAYNSEGPDCSSQRRACIDDSVDKNVPMIALSLPSNSAYYLLDDFNHHHQHTVLTTKNSSSTRYSCTFRLLRESHNIAFWLERCRKTVSQFHKKGYKVYRSEQLLLTEVESEWLRQYFIQGRLHSELHSSTWGESMGQLLNYWSQLERRTYQTLHFLQAAAEGSCHTNEESVPIARFDRKTRDRQRKAVATLQEVLERESSTSESSLFEMLAELLEERATMRELWSKREMDYVFSELDSEYRPSPVPFIFDPLTTDNTVGSSPMPGSPNSLRRCANNLRAFGRSFVSGVATDLLSVTDGAIAGSGDHAKGYDWTGWAKHDLFGVEMQSPWAELLLKGEKTIETRVYDLPKALLDRWIAVIQSPTGQPGKSSLADNLDFKSGSASIIGWCKFSSVKKYTSMLDFVKDENRHLVEQGRSFGWDEGSTSEIFGWIVSDMKRTGNEFKTDYTAKRRMRSLFELQAHSNAAVKKQFQQYSQDVLTIHSKGRPRVTRRRKKRRY